MSCGSAFFNSGRRPCSRGWPFRACAPQVGGERPIAMPIAYSLYLYLCLPLYLYLYLCLFLSLFLFLFLYLHIPRPRPHKHSFAGFDNTVADKAYKCNVGRLSDGYPLFSGAPIRNSGDILEERVKNTGNPQKTKTQPSRRVLTM